jgi:magnesium chelatase family protein
MLECRCTPPIIPRYLGKISGPLLDRIDLHIEVPAVAFKEMRAAEGGVSSAEIHRRPRRRGSRQRQAPGGGGAVPEPGQGVLELSDSEGPTS